MSGSLLGVGAGLLANVPPIQAGVLPERPSFSPSGSEWTGYGGVGDFAWSNGNTETVMNAAHEVRDGKHSASINVPVEETYDLIVVGGGFSGLSAALEFEQSKKSGQTCLILENHPIFGGAAKQNTFEVGGKRLSAPQGSNEAVVPPAPENAWSDFSRHYARNWQLLGLPYEIEYQKVASSVNNIRIPHGHYSPMLAEQNYDVGYYFGNHSGQSGWAVNPMQDGFKKAAIPTDLQREYTEFTHNRRDVVSGKPSLDRWLDSMSYKDLLEKELGYSKKITEFMDPFVAVGNYGVACDGISAYAAKRLYWSGTYPSKQQNPFLSSPMFTFEGGNSAVIKHLVKKLIPNGISGGNEYQDIVYGNVNFSQLDVPSHSVRMRLNSTVTQVEHDGKPNDSECATVTYSKKGRLHRVRAKAVVMAIGGWVIRRTVRGLPERYFNAYQQFNHGPVLTVNIALTNWRFMEKLGIASARWFEGFGWHTTLRSYAIGPKGSNGPELNPNDPTVLTLYVPYLHPGHDTKTQGILARTSMLSQSYSQIEQLVLEQMHILFGKHGFNAKKDVAGIILNRWGHAYVSPQPGFFFGKDGNPAPRDIVREPFGRIAFAHSEFGGNQNMLQAMYEAHRAVQQMQPMLQS